MASHSNITHLYAVTRYRGAPSGQWQNETAQFGLRLGVCFGDQTPPLSEGDWTLPTHTVVDDSTVTTVGQTRYEHGFSNDGASDAYSLAFQAAVADTLGAFAAAQRGLLAAAYVFDSIRLYPILADGTCPTEPTIVTRLDSSWNPNPIPSDTLSPQNAVVLSLGTGVRSRKGRGRIYWGPLPRSACDTNGLVTSTWRVNLPTAYAAMLDDLRALSTDPGVATAVPIVWHRGTATGAVINEVRADDMLDTQRRREGQRTPVWASYPLT